MNRADARFGLSPPPFRYPFSLFGILSVFKIFVLFPLGNLSFFGRVQERV